MPGADDARLLRAALDRLRRLADHDAGAQARRCATFRLPLLRVYGLTETTGGVIAARAGRPRRRTGRAEHLLRSAGTAVPVGRAAGRRPGDRRGARPGEVGEVWLRAPNVMPGYFNRPGGDRGGARRRTAGCAPATAGYLDEEGYLFLTDRIKDMIVSGGENVYPIEVEEALAQHPDVAEVAVIGVPDERWGETVKALVVRARRARSSAPTSWSPSRGSGSPATSCRARSTSSTSCRGRRPARCSSGSFASGTATPRRRPTSCSTPTPADRSAAWSRSSLARTSWDSTPSSSASNASGGSRPAHRPCRRSSMNGTSHVLQHPTRPRHCSASRRRRGCVTQRAVAWEHRRDSAGLARPRRVDAVGGADRADAGPRPDAARPRGGRGGRDRGAAGAGPSAWFHWPGNPRTGETGDAAVVAYEASIVAGDRGPRRPPRVRPARRGGLAQLRRRGRRTRSPPTRPVRCGRRAAELTWVELLEAQRLHAAQHYRQAASGIRASGHEPPPLDLDSMVGLRLPASIY